MLLIDRLLVDGWNMGGVVDIEENGQIKHDSTL